MLAPEPVPDKEVKGLAALLYRDLLQSAVRPVGRELALAVEKHIALLKHRKRQKRSENLVAHLRAVAESLPDRQMDDPTSRQRDLFDDWVEGAQDVDPGDDVLSGLWHELLREILTDGEVSKHLVSKMRRLDGVSARLLIQIGTRCSVTGVIYGLRRSRDDIASPDTIEPLRSIGLVMRRSISIVYIIIGIVVLLVLEFEVIRWSMGTVLTADYPPIVGVVNQVMDSTGVLAVLVTSAVVLLLVAPWKLRPPFVLTKTGVAVLKRLPPHVWSRFFDFGKEDLTFRSPLARLIRDPIKTLRAHFVQINHRLSK